MKMDTDGDEKCIVKQNKHGKDYEKSEEQSDRKKPKATV